MKATLVSVGICTLLFGATLNLPAQPLPVLQRLPNTTLQMPQVPQSFGYKTERAFGTLTFSSPVAVRSVPGETNRIFVVEQTGRIFAITNLAVPNKTLFLDLSKRIAANDAEGLFGLAFHPGYATNGYFYLCYNLDTTSPAGSGRHYRVARFQLSADNPNAGLTNSELPLITQKNRTAARTCNDLAFGPDGYLYIAVGWISSTTYPANHSQRIDGDLEGGILRIDVDNRPDSLSPHPHAASSTNYAIPRDNPFVEATAFNGAPVDSTQVRTEYYATGLRNPWRMSFDTATGLLYCGDAGEAQREEIDIIVKGGNYGWAFREGTINGPGASLKPPGLVMIDPIHEYRHVGGFSVVIGGVVYRGDRLPQLQGSYIFGDSITANIWALRYAGTGAVSSQKLLSEASIVAYGTDPSNGDLLLVNYTGSIKRLIYSTNLVGTPLPPTLADTGAFADLKTLTPAAGIVPYQLNVPFWSDNAHKTRWFSLPNPSQTIVPSAEAHWLFPTGTVWIKHFELELTNGVPESTRRLETRFLVRNSEGVYGVTYRWGDSLTNAALVSADGLDEEFEIAEGGVKRTQTWHYPSRVECLTCHTPLAGLTLGFNTQQLNRDSDYGGVLENQIRALNDAGYFQTPLSGLHTLPALAHATNDASSLDYRVHSYLAANCAQCHQPGGIGRGSFDARITTPLSEAGIIDGSLLNDLGDSQNRVVQPGSLEKSVLFSRLANLGERHMPPLATSVLNPEALNLLSAWITNGLAGHQSYADWQIAHFGSTNAPNTTPGADADGDGAVNQLEYLTGSNPLLAGDGWGISIVRGEKQADIHVPRIANRGFQVQWTTNLFGTNVWQPLDIAGNEPIFSATNSNVEMQDMLTNAPNKFYRARILEP